MPDILAPPHNQPFKLLHLEPRPTIFVLLKRIKHPKPHGQIDLALGPADPSPHGVRPIKFNLKISSGHF